MAGQKTLDFSRLAAALALAASFGSVLATMWVHRSAVRDERRRALARDQNLLDGVRFETEIAKLRCSASSREGFSLGYGRIEDALRSGLMDDPRAYFALLDIADTFSEVNRLARPRRAPGLREACAEALDVIRYSEDVIGGHARSKGLIYREIDLGSLDFFPKDYWERKRRASRRA